MPAGTGTLNLGQSITFLQTVFGQSQQLSFNFPSAAGNTIPLSAGSGANQYNHCYANSALSVASGTPQVLNLNSVGVTQPDGSNGVFTDLIYIGLQCPAANTDYISVGAGLDPVADFTNAIKVRPGETILISLPLAAGIPITTTTADRLTFTANSGTQTIAVLLLGH